MDHYEAALGHRATAVATRETLVRLHDQHGDDVRVKRVIASKYDELRQALKLAEIEALLAIGQGLRDLFGAIEGRR